MAYSPGDHAESREGNEILDRLVAEDERLSAQDPLDEHE
jgi:hypothetical protein